MPLSDAAVGALRALADWPDLGDTKYRVLDRIGRGGMGTVYLAHDAALDRRVAIKVLSLPEPHGESAARLAREARILASLEHPGLVPVHDVGLLPDGRPYYVMKFVGGARLDVYLQSPRTEAERLAIFARICETLAFVHAAGVIHRDLKPQNIMVGPFGEVLVLDWGLARVRHDRTAAPATGTQPGTVLGTEGYMAPEMAAGRADASDDRTDVYALGGLLEVLAGDPHDPGLPRPLAAVVRRARSADPGDRYPTVTALAADVERYRAGDRVGAYREGPLEWTGRLVAKHRTAVVLVAAYIVARIALLALR
jgi:eukaryotic-like serine/threonine-protein kinase